MALVKNGVLATSSFVDASGAEAIPPTGPVIVNLDQWKAQRDELLKRGTPLGIRMHSDQPPELIAADLLKDYRTALADFSVWYQPTADGRPTAMQLRHKH